MIATMQQTWTFAITGEVRSGAGAVLSAINIRGSAVCYVDLLHHDPQVRKDAHEAYFGECQNPIKLPEWYVDGITSPWQYINHTVLASRTDLHAVGLYIPYRMMRKLELYDLFEHKAKEGGFSVIHVVRNPVACFVSMKQAEQSGVWTRSWNAMTPTRLPSPVRISAEDLTTFCREHSATLGKIRNTCRDHLEINYRDLVLNYQDVMRAVFDHLELPEVPSLARPSCKRLRNRPIKDRVSNWTEVRLDVPSDVRAQIDADDLF